jgi:hypothetical protein
VIVGGFIVLADGRAYAASNWATDATLRAIARSVTDDPLRTWLLAQQSEVVGMGMTSVDLREIAPQLRPVMASAIRDAFRRVQAEGRFDQLTAGDTYWDGWLQLFADLVEMLDRSEAGEPPSDFNPHMRGLLPSRNGRVGPGWLDERG